MSIFLVPFSTPGDFEILPALTLSAMRCPDPRFDTLHGYELALAWGSWGNCLRVLFKNEDEP